MSNESAGLSVRNEDGSIATVEHEYEHAGDEFWIEFTPPNDDQIERLENDDEDIEDSDAVDEVLDDVLVDPDPDEVDLLPVERIAYTMAIFDWHSGGADGQMAQVLQAIEEREGDVEGNS